MLPVVKIVDLQANLPNLNHSTRQYCLLVLTIFSTLISGYFFTLIKELSRAGKSKAVF